TPFAALAAGIGSSHAIGIALIRRGPVMPRTVATNATQSTPGIALLVKVLHRVRPRAVHRTPAQLNATATIGLGRQSRHLRGSRTFGSLRITLGHRRLVRIRTAADSKRHHAVLVRNVLLNLVVG